MSDGHRRLAAAVIAKASEDADRRLFLNKRWVNHPRTGKRLRMIEVDSLTKQAIRFLTTPNYSLRFWCLVADISVGAVMAVSRRKYAYKLKQLEALKDRVYYICGRAA